MGGPSKSETDRQRQLAEQDAATSREWLDYAKQDRARREELMAPVLAHNQEVLKDRNSSLQAAAPAVGEIGKQFETAMTGVENDPNMSGAVKDFANYDLRRSKAGAIAKYLNDTFLKALDTQSGLASGYGNFSTGEAATGLRGSAQASDANNLLMQQQAQKLQSWLNFGSGLAGAAGAAVGRRR